MTNKAFPTRHGPASLNITMKPILTLALLALLIPAFAPAGLSEKSSLSREPGAVYVEDLFDKPVRLALQKDAPIFYQLDGKRRLGTLAAGQDVKLVAISDRAYRVRGRAAQGEVSGWIGTAFVKDPSPDFRDNMKKLHERQQLVEKLIDAKEVALGMTPDEVVASLGAPDERSSKVDANTMTESYAYLTYNKVPQVTPRRDAYGRIYNAVTYVKVETGRRTINFTDGVVSSLEENEKASNKSTAKIVVPPIVFH